MLTMSKEMVLQFFAAVDQSPELQRQLQPLDLDESPEGVKKFISIATTAGYPISVEDLRAAARARHERHVESGEQLSEADLEEVAGGGCFYLSHPRYQFEMTWPRK